MGDGKGVSLARGAKPSSVAACGTAQAESPIATSNRKPSEKYLQVGVDLIVLIIGA